MVRTSMLTAAALLAAPGPAWALESPVQEVIPYPQARRLLLARGFAPFVMPGAPSCDEDNPRCYPELMSCTHKRHWICDYTWHQGKAIYQIETNSDAPVVDSFYCLLNCAPKPRDARASAVPLAPAGKSP